MVRPYGRKNPLPFPCFAAVTCRQSAPDSPRERGENQRVETAGVYPLVPPPGRRTPAEVQRKTPRPLGANTPAAVRAPRSAGAEKDCRPDRANTLTQFAHPAQPVLKRLPPGKGEPPARFKSPGFPVAEFLSFSAAMPLSLQFFMNSSSHCFSRITKIFYKFAL